MTVQELIKLLQNCDQDKPVFIPALIYGGEVSSVEEEDDEVRLG